MAKYRQIQTCFWRDSFVTELTPEEKFFYMYIMTNSSTTQCGIYTFIIKFAEVETGYNSNTIEKLLKKFVEYGKIRYCKETKELMILNWVKYNFVNNRPVISCMNKELQQIKHKPFVKALYNICLNNALPMEQIFKGIAVDELEDAGFSSKESLESIISIDKSNLRTIDPISEQKLCLRKKEEIEECMEVAQDDLKTEGNFREVVNSWRQFFFIFILCCGLRLILSFLNSSAYFLGGWINTISSFSLLHILSIFLSTAEPIPLFRSFLGTPRKCSPNARLLIF